MNQSPSSPSKPPSSRPLSSIGWVAVIALVLGWLFMQALDQGTFMALLLPGLLLTAFLTCIVTERHLPALLVAIFLLMPFQESIAGPTSPINVDASDAIALFVALMLPVMLIRQGRLHAGPVAVPLLIFSAVATISSIVFWDGLDTAASLFRMFVVTVLSVLIFANAGARLSTAHRCFGAYLVGITVLAAATIITFAIGGFKSSEYALGINKNSLGPTFGCGVVIALSYLLTTMPAPRRRLWLMVALSGSTIGLLLSLSRGAWVATGAGFLLILAMTRNVRALLLSVVLLSGLIAVMWSVLPPEAKDYATDISSHTYTIQTRFATMGDVMKAFNSSPLIGVGVGLRKQLEPHDVLVLTLGETGVIGLLAFIGMFAAGFYTFIRAARLTRGDPQAWSAIVIGAAVLLVSLTHGLMDVYWRRGVGFMGWSCVGLAASMILQRQSARVAVPVPASAALRDTV